MPRSRSPTRRSSEEEMKTHFMAFFLVSIKLIFIVFLSFFTVIVSLNIVAR